MSIPTLPVNGAEPKQDGNAANPPASLSVQQQQQPENNPQGQWVYAIYNPATAGGYMHVPPGMGNGAPHVMYPSHAAPQVMYTPHAAPQVIYAPQAAPQMMPAFPFWVPVASAPWPNVHLPLAPAVPPPTVRSTEESKENNIPILSVLWEEGVDSHGNREWTNRDTKERTHSDPYK